jgi:K+-sensing histidine kinase KdpD
MVRISKEYISVGFSSANLKERNRNLSILININNFVSSCLSPKEALDAAAAKVMEHFSFRAARMYLMDKGGRSLSLVASRGVDTTGLEHVKISEGFTGNAARTRSLIAQNVSDLEDQKRAAMLLSKAKIDLLVAVGNAIAVAVNHSRLCDELAKNVKELEEKNETIEFFTYTASHDIKSPLIGIYGLAKHLARQYTDVLDERGKNYCGQI